VRPETGKAGLADSGGTSLLLSLLVIAHLAIVSSTIWQDRPLIWPLHNDTIHRVGRGADFYAVYHAGLNLRRGIDPYINNVDGVTPYWYPFRYLPIVATVLQPLTSFTPRTAYSLWVLLIEGTLAVLLFALWTRIPERGIRLAAIGMLLINSPYFLELYMGQFTFVAITLCCLGLLLPAGQLLFCSSVLLKPLTLAALPALASRRRYWSHAAAAILGVTLAALPYFLRHSDQWSVFFDANFRPQGGLDSGNYGFVRLLWLVLQDLRISMPIERWDNAVWSIRLMTLLATSLLVFHSKRRSVTVGASALLLGHFLTYQHVWEHHMSGVCVLGTMLLTTRDRMKPLRIAVISSLVLLSSPTLFGVFDVAKNPLAGDPSAQWPRYASYAIVLSKVLPTLVLYLSAIGYLCLGGLVSPVAALRMSWRRDAPEPAS
jgi:glycosyl transferase family 87